MAPTATAWTGANTNGYPRLATPGPSVGGGQNSLGLAESLISSDFSSEVLTQGPALALAGEFLDDIQVDFLIKATQADRRNISLNAPRLTFTNGQISNIYVATQIAFVSDLSRIVSESAVAFDPELPARVTEGVHDRGRHHLRRPPLRHPQRRRLDRQDRRLRHPARDSGRRRPARQLRRHPGLHPGARPTTVTRVQTTVTVPDQGTILLGGQRLVTEQEAETGVPVLSKIPILNRFFTNRISSKEEQTLLILLKPTILIQNEEEERNFPGLADSLRLPYGG